MAGPVRSSSGSWSEFMSSTVDEQQREVDDYLDALKEEDACHQAMLEAWNERNEGVDYEGAAREANFALLKQAKANGALVAEMCQEAAVAGQIYVLQWLHANGCPWDETTCAGAALGGHLEVLQWARANGCPWDERTRKYAAMGGHTDILQWISANGLRND